MVIQFKMAWPNAIARTVRWGICGADSRYMHIAFTTTSKVRRVAAVRIQILIPHTAALQTTLCPKCGRSGGVTVVPNGQFLGSPVVVSSSKCRFGCS